jgi:hypothetical protein
MKRIAFLMAFGALTLAFGCDDGRDDGDGGMTLTDSGLGTDGGSMMEDSGSTSMADAGPQSCMVTTDSDFFALPESCMPRCERATATCLNGCSGDTDCQDDCFAADHTPVVPLIVNGTTAPDPLDCETCVNVQFLSCVNESCPSELTAYFTCVQSGGGGGAADGGSADGGSADGGPPCSAEIAALNACQSTNMAAVQSCAMTRETMCIDL